MATARAPEAAIEAVSSKAWEAKEIEAVLAILQPAERMMQRSWHVEALSAELVRLEAVGLVVVQ